MINKQVNEKTVESELVSGIIINGSLVSLQSIMGDIFLPFF